jgi:chromosome segregation ATPase
MFIMAFLAIPLILIVLVALMVRIRNLRKNAKANIVSFTNQNGDSKASAKSKESKFGKWMSEKTNKNKRNGFTLLNQDSYTEDTVHLNKKMSTPEDVPRLVDLIKVNDPKLMTAFYYSLRNTLVATSLEQATRIAYGQSQRHRVVTLKGEIIEISGTMSGGGQPMRGRMGSKIVNDEYSAESVKKFQESWQRFRRFKETSHRV